MARRPKGWRKWKELRDGGAPLAEWYTAYLRCSDWKEKRRKVMEFFNCTCLCCGYTNQFTTGLHAHHLNYDHLEEEIPGVDVIVVCESCHKKIHRRQITDAEQKAISYFRRAIESAPELASRMGGAANLYRDYLTRFKAHNGYRFSHHRPDAPLNMPL